MSNYMADVAKMLGVELGEKFKVAKRGCRYETVYYFDRYGAWEEDGQVADAIIPALLIGSYEIIKLPWKPKYGDKYYTYYTNKEEWLIWDSTWSGDVSDYARLKSGIVFRTSQEALTALPQRYKELTGKELKE